MNGSRTADVLGKIITMPVTPNVIPHDIIHSGTQSDSTQYDFRSVIKFVEQNFHPPQCADYDRSVNSHAGMFDYPQTPLKPAPLKPQKCPPAHYATERY